MGPTEWTIIGVGVALFLALGTVIRFSNSAIRNELKSSNAEIRTEIAQVRTEIVELRAEFKSDTADMRAESKSDMADMRAEFKSDMADMRAEFKSDMAELRTGLKLDIQANRAEIITNRRMLGRFALHRHGEDGLPLAPLTDALDPPEGAGEPPGTENGSDD